MSIDTEIQWAELLRSANRGDARAYRAFLAAVLPHIASFVRAGLERARAGSVDVDDVVQEVMIALHSKRHTWREADPVRPWLFAIARYKLIDALRRRWRRVELDIDDFSEVLSAAEPEPQLSPVELDRALASLPAQQRRIVAAISVEGRSIAETSAAFNLKEGAVRVALHRGLKTLRARFGKSGS